VGLSSVSNRTESVSLDWRTPLSHAKSQSYLSTLHRLETSYAMFSVTLDEAIGMRRRGRLGKAYQRLAVAPALCQKLALPLGAVLRAMTRHSRHFGITPTLASLDPENFQGSKSQRVARYNGMLSHVLLTRRSQFLHKISALTELVEELGANFSSAAEKLGEGTSQEPDQYWEQLDASHYDLNTCLREAVVLLKCFFLALPKKQLAEFQCTLQHETQPFGPTSRVPSFARNLAHRRLAPIKGQ
jgi:hypothetical protein